MAWKPTSRKAGRFFSRLPIAKSLESLIVPTLRGEHSPPETVLESSHLLGLATQISRPPQEDMLVGLRRSLVSSKPARKVPSGP